MRCWRTALRVAHSPGPIASGAFRLSPSIFEHYPPEATDGREEMFDLVIFDSYEVRETMRGGVWHLEIGEPTWKRLDRASVEALVSQAL